MKIGIIAAMEEEILLLREAIEVQSVQTIGMRKFYNGILSGKQVTLVLSRCGKVAAASTATTLIQQFGVDLILFTGVAGGANKGRSIGDIVISKRLVQHDMDASGFSGAGKFEIPILEKAYFDVDEGLLKQAVTSAHSYVSHYMDQEVDRELRQEFGITIPQIVAGTIASGDQFISDSNKIKELSREIDDLQCVEMEGAAVAQVCYEYGIKLIVIRVISDHADEEAEINFGRFIEKTARHFTGGIVREVLKELNESN